MKEKENKREKKTTQFKSVLILILLIIVFYVFKTHLYININIHIRTFSFWNLFILWYVSRFSSYIYLMTISCFVFIVFKSIYMYIYNSLYSKSKKFLIFKRLKV